MHEEDDDDDPNWLGAPEDQPFRKRTAVAKDTTSPTPVVESSTAKTPARLRFASATIRPAKC